jgi:hypothetical protein
VIASLRNIATAQRLFREAGHTDGGGGSFADLTGVADLRGGAPLKTPLLSRAFRPTGGAHVERGGYYFRLDRTDGTWQCYTWPVDAEDKEHRTFYVDAAEEILATRGYAGQRAPSPDAVRRDGRAWTSAG